jgi:ABC-type phosphate transport system auxiliary subunit
MLRIEFEQNLAANEQTGPINREMRHLITSLQNHNQQLKGEVHRYKRKYKDANGEIPKVSIKHFMFFFVYNNLEVLYYSLLKNLFLS